MQKGYLRVICQLHKEIIIMFFYLVFLFIVGVITYVVSKGAIPCYWFVTQSLGLPIAAYISGALLDEDILESYRKVTSVFEILLFLFLMLESFSNRNKLNSAKGPLICVVLLILFQIIWGTYHLTSKSFFSMISPQRYIVVFLFIPLYLYFVNKTSTSIIKNTVLVTLIAELLLAFVNHFAGIHLYLFQQINLYGLGFEGEYTSGTFKRFNNLAAFLVVIQSAITTEYVFEKRIDWKKFLLFTVPITYVVFITGSRNALITLFFVVGFPFILKKQYKKIAILFVPLIIFLVLLVLRVGSKGTTGDATSGIERNLIGLSEKFDKKNANYGVGTYNMNMELIEKYGTLNPLGQGLTANRDIEKAYGNKNYFNDSRLGFYYVEYGWLYILLLISYWISVYNFFVKTLKGESKKSLLNMFVGLLLLAVTDEGIFNMLLFGMLGMYSYYLNRYNYYESFTIIKRNSKSNC